MASLRGESLREYVNRRQGFAFEELQKGATGSGDIADLIRHTVFVDGRNRASNVRAVTILVVRR